MAESFVDGKNEPSKSQSLRYIERDTGNAPPR